MRKVMLLAVVVVVGLSASAALALAPMGPPTAGLKQAQWRVGVDYSYSKMDLEVSWPGDTENTIWKDVQSNMIFANIGYGIADSWEVFGRLGFANADIDEEEYAGVTETLDPAFKGDYGFAWGFGTKYTFAQQENLSWGVLFQMNWLKSKDTLSEFTDADNNWEGELKIDAYEMQIAVGPTWKAAENVSIYGGPFLDFVSGDAEWSESGVDDEEPYIDPTESGDVEEASVFGGYVGAQWDFSENAAVFGEFQLTGDAWAIGTGVGWKF